MKVTLIRYTPDALELLVGTKTTRLRGRRPEEMSKDELYEHFQYMLSTIRSPFDFVDYIFHIENVSKNFTHQLVRTRTGSYQQESSRAVEVTSVVRPEAFEYPTQPAQIDDWRRDDLARTFDDAIASAGAYYRELIASGAALGDARAVLPSNMATNIDAKFSLRTLSDMAKTRLCRRTQGEYQTVFRAMVAAVLEVHPWADPLLQVACVADGSCAFPRWGSAKIDTIRGGEPTWDYQCDMYRPWMDTTVERENLRKIFWSKGIIESNPVANEGKTS